MRKERKAFIPLFSSLIIMLALNMVPHHHHGDFLCFSFSACVTQHEEHAGICKHHHHSHSCSETCKIKSFQQTGIIKGHYLSFQDDMHITVDVLSLPLFLRVNFHEDLYIPEIRQFVHALYREYLYPENEYISRPRRAPPVTIA